LQLEVSKGERRNATNGLLENIKFALPSYTIREWGMRYGGCDGVNALVSSVCLHGESIKRLCLWGKREGNEIGRA
jgi:hypothetical protein